MVGGDDDLVQEAAALRQRASPQRLRRRLVERLAAVVEHPRVGQRARGEFPFHAPEHAGAGGWRDHQIVWRVVEPIGVAPRVVIVVRATGIRGVVARRTDHAVVQCAVDGDARVRIGEHHAALRGEGAAVQVACAWCGIPRLLVVLGAEPVLVHIADMQCSRCRAAFAAEGDFHGARVAAVFVAARVDAGGEPGGAGGDDVHHAGDGVRTVDGRGAFQRHLHPPNDARRQCVQIRGAGHAAAGGAVDPAQSVHQHQDALGAQMPQVDVRCAGADAAAIGGKAEVAAAVEAGVQRRAGDRQAGENVA